MAKAKTSKIDKKAVQYVRDMVELKLTRTGCPCEKASDLCANVSDAEIQECLGEEKVGALGDGTFINWLKTHQDDIRSAVDKIFSLLSLFAATASKPEEGEEESSEEE